MAVTTSEQIFLVIRFGDFSRIRNSVRGGRRILKELKASWFETFGSWIALNILLFANVSVVYIKLILHIKFIEPDWCTQNPDNNLICLLICIGQDSIIPTH